MQSPLSGHRRFETVRQLGAGGMGVVYEALDRDTGERVALKTLHHLNANSLYRFKNEFRAIRDIRHPNLIRLLELHGEDDQWFFTMELLEGKNLLQTFRPTVLPSAHSSSSSGDAIETELALVKDDATDVNVDGRRTDVADLLTLPPAAGPHRGAPTQHLVHAEVSLDWAQLRRALLQVVEAIEALHAASKVHRDLKPANIVVTTDERVVLLDFGLILDANERESTDSNIAGTVAYMAPEQGAGERVGASADWYALGVMMHQLLTGRLPFVGPPAEVLAEKRAGAPSIPRWMAPTAPVELCQLATDLMHPNPDERPGIDEIRTRLGSTRTTSQSGERSLGSDGGLVVVGRSAELAALRGAAARVSAHRAASVVVAGPSGFGKSALVNHFLEGLRRDHPNLILLRSRCRKDERVPFQALDELVDSLSHALLRLPDARVARLLPRGTRHLVELFPVLRRVPTIDALSVDGAGLPPDERRASAFRALHEIVGALTAEHLVVVVVEEVNDIDRDSAIELHRLVAGDRAPATLVVSTAREVPARTERALAAMGLPPATRVLTLEPLSTSSARELVQRMEPSLDESRVADLVSAARGHPGHLQDIVRHARRNVGAGIVTLEEAIRARLTAVEESARPVLDILAVLGEAPESTVARIAGIEGGRIRLIVTSLEADRLVRVDIAHERRRLVLSDARVTEVVRASVEGPRLEALRASALEVVLSAPEGESASVGVVVDLLLALGRAREAVDRLLAAADDAERQLAFDRVAELLDEAIRIGTPEASVEAAWRERAARCLSFSGDLAAAGVQLERAARLSADRVERVDRLARASMHFASCYAADAMVRACDAGLRLLGTAYPRTTAARITWLLSALLAVMLGPLARKFVRESAVRQAERRAMHAFAMAMQIGSYVTTDLLLGTLATFRVIAEGQRLPHSIERIRGLWAESVLFAAMQLPRLSRSRVLQMERIGSALATGEAVGAVRFGSTIVETKLDDFERAEVEAERGLEHAPWMDAFEFIGMTTRVGLVLFLTGHVERGLAWTQRGLARSRPDVSNGLLELCRDTVETMYAILGRPNDGMVRFAAVAALPDPRHGRAQFGVGAGLLYYYETDSEGPHVDALLRMHEHEAVPTSHPADEELLQYTMAPYIHLRRAFAGSMGARAALDRSLRGSRKVGGWRLLAAHPFIHEAGSRILHGDYERALDRLDAAERVARESNNPWATFESLLMRVRCFVRMGYERDARLVLRTALALAEEQRWSRRHDRAMRELGRLLDKE